MLGLSFREWAWLLPQALQVAILIVMIVRKLHRVYAAFFAYMLFHAARWVALYAIAHSGMAKVPQYTVYFYTYWSLQCVETILAFVVVAELYFEVFHHYGGLRQLGLTLFRWAGVALAFVAIMATGAAGANGVVPVMQVALFLDRSFCIVQCGLLAFLFLFSNYFALNWRHYTLGIGLGFVFQVTAYLAALSYRAEAGAVAATGTFFNVLTRGSYDVALLIWIVYLALPVRERQWQPEMMPSNDLIRWNRTLLELTTR
jgi:hypothetical protein